MLDFLKSLGLWGDARQLEDSITLSLDGFVLRQGIKCPVCLDKHIWKDGHEKRLSRIPIQRYFCPNCGRSFCLNTFAPWYWCKYSPAVIMLFLWYFFCGESILHSREICSFRKKIPVWKTLWNWLQKFGEKILYRYGFIKHKVSRYRAWQTDEMYLRNKPIVGTIDPQTGTIFLTPEWHANKEKLFSHTRKVIHKWGMRPRSWWTDEWAAYNPVFEQQKIPHHTIKHRDYKFKNSHGITTNAIENNWRQFRSWLWRRNGIKHQVYADFYVKIYEAKHNTVKNPLILINLLI